MSTRRRRGATDSEPTASLASVEDADGAPSVLRRGASRRGKAAPEADAASAPTTPARVAAAIGTPISNAAGGVKRAASALFTAAGAPAHRGQTVLGLGLLLAFLAFATWHYQLPHGIRKLQPHEINKFMAAVEKLPIPDAASIAAKLRPWAEADDGKAVFMVNLMRQHSTPVVWIRRLGGELLGIPQASNFNGTAAEANAKYEAAVGPLLLAHGAYPVVLGRTQAPKPLISGRPERDWTRAGLVRYPNRRAFLRLITHPAYARHAPLKFMAMEVDLIPVSADVLGFVGCDLTWIVALALLSVFLGAGWARAARRA